MKKFSLVAAIILSIIAITISFVSGGNSGSTGLEISNFILRIITGLFPNNNIVLAELHTILQIVGHIILYVLLGVLWFHTARLWNLSLMRIVLIGLMIASINELVNLIAYNLEPNFLEGLAKDFLPFLFGSLLLFKLCNKEKSVVMSDVLEKLKNNELTTEEAYKEIYRKQGSKVRFTNHAHFLKLRIVIPDEKKVTRFLRVLFFIPIPLFIVRFVFTFVKDEDIKNSPFTKNELLNMINSKGINVNVNTSDKTKVIVKTI